VTKIYNSISGEKRNFIWKNRYKDLKKIGSVSDFLEVKKRTRILVIDDEDSFPIQLFRDEGYSIDKWDIVKDYSKLENGFYDIIVLDIKGVARHISENDGLGVLENLKKTNPSQIVVSYSQYSYDLNKLPFFQMADENIAKPSDYLKIRNIIDNLLINFFKPDRYIKALDKVLEQNNISKKQRKIIYQQISKTVLEKRTLELDNILGPILVSTNIKRSILNLSQTIVKFY
jgi:DNA-binding NtrC family response regulator